MVKQICFDYEHYAALSELPEPDRRGRAGFGFGACGLFALPGRRCGASAQRADPPRQQLRERGFPCGALRRTFAALLCAGQPCRRPDRGAGHRFGPLRAGVLSLRTVPSGAGRCRTAAGSALAGDHVRRRNGLGGLLRDAAASLYLQVVTLRRCSHPTTFSTRTITC